MSLFKNQQKVLFQHCDPAGIVFYPRYFEMVNAVVEEWFSEQLGVSFETLHGPMKAGIPTVHLETTFHAPSYHGDILDFELEPKRLGTSSLDLSITACCKSEKRFSMNSTLIYVDKKGSQVKPAQWPLKLRKLISD